MKLTRIASLTMMSLLFNQYAMAETTQPERHIISASQEKAAAVLPDLQATSNKQQATSNKQQAYL